MTNFFLYTKINSRINNFIQVQKDKNFEPRSKIKGHLNFFITTRKPVRMNVAYISNSYLAQSFNFQVNVTLNR